MQHSLVELIEVITKLITEWETQFIREYEEEGFTARQIEYIDVINRLGNPNLGEIAKALKLSKPSVTAIVERLSGKGYVQKFQSDADRRSFHVHLSDKGKRMVEMHNRAHEKIAELFESKLDGEDLTALVALLNKVFPKE